ncbi:ABC transporter ATP-binding protein [Allonocardiopsis opalescens]|uniref:Amino acid/amide ABC transporter ATP-binding protein 1 (HAAT family) n=1 Tax=Allonocardiopsis opalescens TaxID=1144618 RepID=A0A2T0Q0T1_9ACTN|nr:ATP-binding cassette domain-containing protein [Allonocardiopsis opalescens]PRX97399.1 amino acid/amide ABC transporter ATP-binding protein 1 (HAAT family) [Allonocardiopsis opalescens]
MTSTEGTGGLLVEDVSVRFGGVVALRDVSLTAAPNTVTGIIGPNGAGKTTLYNALCGLVRADSGRISWRGTPLLGRRPDELAGLGVARTLQGMNLFPLMTVAENVMVGADRLARGGTLAALTGLGRVGRDERRLRARALDALAEFGVAHLAEALPPSLPFGLRKRVALARALAADPDLLLLDEPAGGLSAEEIAELAERIRGFRERMTVLLVEHHMDMVMDVCDHIAVLNFGRVIAAGPPEAIRADAAVTEAYLGDAA